MSYYSHQETFSDILRVLIEQSGISVLEFVNIIQEKDSRYEISRYRLYEYLRGEHVPSFEKAKFLFNLLDYKVSDDELVSILDESRRKAREEKKYYSRSADREIQCAARIKYRNILPGLTPDQAEQTFWERVEFLTGGRSISKYIQGLIAKDMNEWVLSKEEVEKID